MPDDAVIETQEGFALEPSGEETPVDGETPAAPAPTAPTEAEMQAYAEKWAKDQGWAPPQPVQQPTGGDPRIAERDRLIAEAPELYGAAQAEAFSKAFRLTQEIARDEAMAQMMPLMNPMLERNALHGIELDAKGMEYINTNLGNLTPAQRQAVMSDPKTRDLFVRAAKDYSRENTPAKMTNIGAHSEPFTLSRDEQSDIAQFEKETGIKVTPDMIRDARKYSSGA